jgi:hypothetical protein
MWGAAREKNLNDRARGATKNFWQKLQILKIRGTNFFLFLWRSKNFFRHPARHSPDLYNETPA